MRREAMKRGKIVRVVDAMMLPTRRGWGRVWWCQLESGPPVERPVVPGRPAPKTVRV